MRCEGSPRGAEMILHQMERKGIMTGWNRCMSCEDRSGTYLSQCVSETLAAFHKHAQPFECYERGMPLVQMPQPWLDTQRAQGPHASDAEDHFLLQTSFQVSAVKPRRQFAIPRSVLLNIRIQQKQPNAAKNNAPHSNPDVPLAHLHCYDARLAIRSHGTLNRCVNPIQALVNLRLPTV